MAYKSCAAQIAASIVQDCNRPLVGGYTGRAVIIPANDFAKADVVVDANNPRKIMSIVLPPDGSVMPYTIDNVFATPFTGSTTAGNADSGRNGYLKTIAVRVPMRGADVSRDIIEPLVKDADGFVVIAEKRDKVGDGSFEVIGYQNSMRGDIASVTRDESANGGDWLVNLTTIEKWAEVTFVGNDDDYVSAKSGFEKLSGYEPNVIRMHTNVENQEFFSLTGDGTIYIDIVKNGTRERITLQDPVYEDTILPTNCDANTEIIIWGDVTTLAATDDVQTALDYIDVSGSESLTNLTLYGEHSLSNVIFSQKNSKITNLDLTETDIRALDTTYLTGLKHLDVSDTKLRAINTENLTQLETLTCQDCKQLRALNLSSNINLKYLGCNDTPLSSLDVSKNVDLEELDCNNTYITDLDLSNNTKLEKLSWCNTGATSLDVSKNVNLKHLDFHTQTVVMLANLNNTANVGSGDILDSDSEVLTTLLVCNASQLVEQSVESWLHSYAPRNGKIYVDENTSQGIITEAEAKDWEVIYVS